MKTLSDVMSRAPVTVGPNTPVREAEWLASRHGIRHLPVVVGDYLVGVVCLCDLRRAHPESGVSKWMSRPVRSANCRTSLDRAARMFREHEVGCLPVVEDGRLAGIVTRADLRREGVEDSGGVLCTACRRHSVHSHEADAHVALCVECAERAHPPEPEEDVSAGD
jgi:CBS-domain-containing membrane protein